MGEGWHSQPRHMKLLVWLIIDRCSRPISITFRNYLSLLSSMKFMCRLWNLCACRKGKNERLSLRKELLFIKQILLINICWFLIWASEDGWNILSMELSIEQGSVEVKTTMNTGIKTRRCILGGKLIKKVNCNKELLLDLILTLELSHDP